MVDAYILVMAGFGALVLLTAWLPMVLKEAPLSLPIVCVAIGAALFAWPGAVGHMPHPQEHLPVIERVTELVVVIALMGAGLKLDRPLGWRSWSVTWRLLLIAMPLTIAVFAALGFGLLGLPLASALLLGAALAPTDPVLAGDVQVGPPGSGEEDETRFALTSEAGLNDGLAFPFVHGAVLLALFAAGGEASLSGWLSYHVAWKLAAGVTVGWAVGRALGWALFHLPNRAKLSRTGDGFVVLGVTFLAYALTEMARGYGFLGVFVAALALRATERDHAYHEKLHGFAEELERLLMMGVLVIFGGMMTGGHLFRALGWPSAAFAVLAIFLVRPAIGWLSLKGFAAPAAERLAISFYGIRGVGSIYYLAYALQRGGFAGSEAMWSTIGLIILCSVVLHGVTVTPVMRRLDAGREGG